MRLKRLSIDRFKNLRQLEVGFADTFTTVLVGQNGTGKSNLIEALAIIFRDLDLGVSPSFAYSIEYECRGRSVVIDATPASRRTMTIRIDGRSVAYGKFSKRAEGSHGLPSFVFGYYSGPTDRLAPHFDTHQQRFAAALLSGQDRPLRPLLYARPVHGQFVLLSFFRTATEDRSILARYLRLVDLESVLFVLKKPHWYNPSRRMAESGYDGQYWGARGVVRTFLDRLFALSLAPVYADGGDRLHLFLPSKQAVVDLAEGYANQAEFFKALESLYISDLIAEVRSTVTVVGADETLSLRELSEGEQQLLMVLGLLRFLETNEGLILLDEPDTHLNPAWSLEYTRLLNDAVADTASTQILMATHDPLVVAGLTAREVLLMKRDANGVVVAAHPAEDPRGMGVAGLLTSEIYGLRASLDLDTLDRLDRKRELSVKDDLSSDERRELTELNDDLRDLDFMKAVRDPLYKPFVEAMTRVELELGLQRHYLGPKSVEARDEIAHDVARLITRRYLAVDDTL